MKKLIGKIQSNLGIRSARTKNITKHVFWSIIYKGGHIAANFLLVPLTISYLDTENYGIWLTLSSFIAWFTFFDIGLGHGLRNKFAEAKAKGDIELAKGYVSTAYFTIGLISLIFVVTSLFASYFLDWANIFNTADSKNGQLRILMTIVFASFGIQLIVKLITTIYTADQRPSMQGKISFLTAVLSLLIIWFLTRTANSSLLIFGSIFSFLPVLILLFLNFNAFTNRYKVYRPNIAYWKNKYFKDIFGLGASFFIIQFSVIILYSTDNFIITQLFDPKAVVPYNIAYKYLSLSSMFFSMILTPYWSSITEAYTKAEFDWIKKSMKNLLKFTLATIILIVIMTIVAPKFYQLWIGEMVIVPMSLTISMAIYFIISVFYSPFNYFINGTGKVKLHMYSFIIGAILNIPLSIILVKQFHFGVEGVIIATSICIAPNIILFPIQYFKLINNQANGIWNK
ncbi:Na+-driven multidrug efflux pump [Arenibacter palladensis]|uniref:Na+-driven multidrug efflux pump n=1 Tax=Arenibacter palladensis TaxID=237373 RepID=A0A1M5G4Z9_9FLAO|nr:polysaccharide biosynthesis C-terminal domain-containing protein [Arenibacter palladensis]SHF98779.1 Na+-driven multidrug efflux pump [Arenibacter palladensis]